MQHVGLQPGTAPLERLEDSLIEDQHFSVTGPGMEVQDGLASDEDHDARMKMWKDMLLSDHLKASTSKSYLDQSGSERMLWWLMGCIGIWVLPDMLGVNPRAAQSIHVILLTAWSWRIITTA